MTHLIYRVNLNLERGGENSHPFMCCFLLLINAFLLVFVNIFLQLEANPVQMHLLHFYLVAVLVSSKLGYSLLWGTLYTSSQRDVQRLGSEIVIMH